MSSISQTVTSSTAPSSYEPVTPEPFEWWLYPYHCAECGTRFRTQDALNRHLTSKDHLFDLEDLAQTTLEAAKSTLEELSSEAECATEDPIATDLFNDLSEVESFSSQLWADGVTRGGEMGREFIEWCESPSKQGENIIGEILDPGDDHPLLNSVSASAPVFWSLSSYHSDCSC